MARTLFSRTKRGSLKAIGKEAPLPTTSDLKILWGRAAARCSICQTQLTLDPEENPAVTLGEMCHIVGEKTSSPRGAEMLPIIERGRYSNLILLCRHDHTIIDKNTKKYTVAVLHKVKDDHEEWVRNTLGQSPDPNDAVYADVIDAISTHLPLDEAGWHSFTDNAVRMILRFDLLDVRGFLNEKLMTTLWPGKHKKLEVAIRKMIEAFSRYISVYESNGEIPDRGNGDFLHPSRGYKLGPSHLAFEWVEREKKWDRACLWLLADFVLKLNDYAMHVRKSINPLYFLRQGRFLIYDDQGTWHGMMPTMILPAATEVKANLKRHAIPYEKGLRRERRRF